MKQAIGEAARLRLITQCQLTPIASLKDEDARELFVDNFSL